MTDAPFEEFAEPPAQLVLADTLCEHFPSPSAFSGQVVGIHLENLADDALCLVDGTVRQIPPDVGFT